MVVNMVLVFVLLFLSNPFGISMTLLLISVAFSVVFAIKTSSLWVMALVILTFSSGVMVMISYSSSMVVFKVKSILWAGFTVFPVIVFSSFVGSSVVSGFKVEYFLKEFSSNGSILLIMVFLIVSMVYMMENCYVYFSPMQSTF